jgi:hypothetical protein
MGKEEASSEHSNMQEELEQVATAFNKQETQKKRERLEAMFNIPDCIKKGGVSYPDNLIRNIRVLCGRTSQFGKCRR